MHATLRLSEYDPTWPTQFAREAARISSAIGSHAVAIEHVGSTSVPGLLAKPVIDIAIAVQSADDAAASVAPMTALGYEHRGAHGEDPQRRYFVLERDGRRDVQVHLYIQPAPAYLAQLQFRDALRADPQLAQAYAAEKRRLAALTHWNKARYSEEKGPFIQAVLARLSHTDGR